MSLWELIVWPFARLMELLYNWTSNYGVSVILFALVVNILLAPFMAKSKKSTMRTSRLQPKLQELQRKHEGNQQKLNEEMQKLYREEGVKPMSGCLWTLIPFPILIALYSVIRQPLQKMMGIAAEDVTKITEWATKNAGFVSNSKGGTYDEIGVVDALHSHWDAAVNALGDFGDKLMDIDYSFLGMNLGEIPNWRIWEADFSNSSVWLPALGLFLIPIIAAFLSWLSMKISQKTNPVPATNQQAASSMQMMNLMMPIMSIWICFIMPAALGVYWIANSIIGILRDLGLTKVFVKQMEKEDAERLSAEREREAEMQRRREETERLRAEGATTRNTNTSKKKMQAQQKQENEERRAANERAERDAKRERMGIIPEDNPSQVGKRRYARGRNYDPNRFGNVSAAAAESTIPELEPETESENSQE